MGVVSDILAWAQRFDRENPCSQPRTCAPLQRDAVLDALKCAAIIPFQVGTRSCSCFSNHPLARGSTGSAASGIDEGGVPSVQLELVMVSRVSK